MRPTNAELELRRDLAAFCHSVGQAWDRAADWARARGAYEVMLRAEGEADAMYQAAAEHERIVQRWSRG